MLKSGNPPTRLRGSGGTRTSEGEKWQKLSTLDSCLSTLFLAKSLTAKSFLEPQPSTGAGARTLGLGGRTGDCCTGSPQGETPRDWRESTLPQGSSEGGAAWENLRIKWIGSERVKYTDIHGWAEKRGAMLGQANRLWIFKSLCKPACTGF